MAGVAMFQSSMTCLSLTCNSFLGQRLAPASFFSVPVNNADRVLSPLIVMKLKRWERKECKPNSLPVLQKMHVKVGDTIKVIAGREKGKIGQIIRVFRHNSTIVVKDTNLKTKHMKSKEQDEPGQIIKVEAPFHSSNVMLYSKENEVASRVGHKMLEDGTRVRYLIKTGEIIDSKDSWKESRKLLSKKQEVSTAA
ncbi:50S ribosomal protein L24 [Zostera marina]|uniref:50S ribosomal protein L24 n=1 Tax=Zostera marina TaxID=29655 RepID=A0A0K9NRC7_ZOSMR|nr:50S ribosomal protein L24 [Zostera marina]